MSKTVKVVLGVLAVAAAAATCAIVFVKYDNDKLEKSDFVA